MRALLPLLVLAAPAIAAAQAIPPQAPSFDLALPPAALVDAALDAHPSILGAQADLTAAQAERRRLGVGPNEYVASGVVQGRHDRPGGADFVEGQLEVSRTLRSGSKAQLDRRTGEAGERAAADTVEDTHHQAARRLAELWFEWLEAEHTSTLDRATVAAFAREAQAVRRRVELRDAAVLELDQTEAALALAQARAAQSAGAARAAKVAVEADYPPLKLPERSPPLPELVELAPAPAAWRAIVLARSHEIRIAESLARRQHAIAARARLDRKPDPTVGVRAFAERGGRETGLGVFVSRPIGGAYRSAIADAEAARAAAADANVAKVRREVEQVADQDIAAVDTNRSAWNAAAVAVRAAEAAARRTRRAYELGERDVADVLLAERQLHDVQRSEVSARVAAWRALTLLRIDAHDLWAEHHED